MSLQFEHKRSLFYIGLLISLLPYAGSIDLFLGPQSVLIQVYYPAHLLNVFVEVAKDGASFNHFAPSLYYALLAFLIFGVLKPSNHTMPWVIWVLYMWVVNGMISITNAGHQLASLLLFINCFYGLANRFDFKRLFHFSLWFQISLLYLIAGISKLFGTLWLSGQALEVVFQLPEFTNPNLEWVANGRSNFLAFITYAILLYQLFFVFLTYIKATKKIALIFGILFHLGVWFIQGIADFAVIMIAAYVFLLDEPKAVLR